MNKIRFPTCREMYPELSQRKITKQIRDQLRFYIYTHLTRSQIKQLILYLNQHTYWAEIFQQHLYRFNVLLSKYCDKRFNRQQRLSAIIDNFQLAEQKMALSLWQKLIQNKSLVLSELTEEFSLNLNINDIDPFEGFFSINIQDKQKQRLYDASFSFLNNDRLLIASIQGPSGKQAQEQVKTLTKALHGIRPMFMLIIGFKLLSKVWQTKLLGIPHKYQAKYRWNDSSRLLFNYDHFWQENNAEFNQGYWQLPLDIERKAIEDIASKKRSMYRKRYEMLDRLEQDITAFMQAV